MVSVCTVPARGGRSCEHFGGYKTINRIPLPLYVTLPPVLSDTWLCFTVDATLLETTPAKTEHVFPCDGNVITCLIAVISLMKERRTAPVSDPLKKIIGIYCATYCSKFRVYARNLTLMLLVAYLANTK